MKRILSIGLTLLVMVGGLVGLAPTATAGELSALGVTLTWNADDLPRVGPFFCEFVPFVYRGASEEVVLGKVELKNASGDVMNWASKIPIPAGETGTLSLHVCSHHLPNGSGPYTIAWTVKSYDSKGGAVETVSEVVYLRPIPPTGLSASAVAYKPTAVDLRWSPPDAKAAVTGYRIKWDGGDKTTTDTTARIEDLPPGTNVTFSVTAVNAGGESDPITVSFQTGIDPVPRPPLPPDEPRDVTLESVAATSVTLAWLPPEISYPEVSKYRIVINNGRVVETTATTQRITGLTPSTRYSLVVTAVNSVGTSPEVKLQVKTDADMSEPRELASVPTSSATTVQLTWLPPWNSGGHPIREYEIVWADPSGALEKRTTKRTSITLPGLAAVTRFTFSVRAINSEGEASPAASITLATPLDPQRRPNRPNRPTEVKVTGTKDTSVAIDWLASAPSDPPVTAYQVLVKGAKTRDVTNTSILLTDLKPETLYEVAVQAISTGGASDQVTLWVRTASTPQTKPAPAPAPAPVPFVGPVTRPDAPVNVNGTPDADGNADTLRQTAPGNWPKKRVAKSGVPLSIEKRAGFVTNAGQTARLQVSAKSPSIKKVTLKLNPKTKTYTMTATLKPGKKSGSVTLAVSAPSVRVKGALYEPLLSTQDFTVRR